MSAQRLLRTLAGAAAIVAPSLLCSEAATAADQGVLRVVPIAIFDADAINDAVTYENPRQFPTGIPYVIVNGAVAVDNQRCTGVFAGQAVP